MTDTLVDANVLIDVLGSDTRWEAWSRQALIAARADGELVLNPIVYAEVAAGFPTQRALDAALPAAYYRREGLPWEAAFNAGRSFLVYRRGDGLKRSPLPDFYIGAHAEVRGYYLLTRDPARYRSAFPILQIISPETRP